MILDALDGDAPGSFVPYAPAPPDQIPQQSNTMNPISNIILPSNNDNKNNIGILPNNQNNTNPAARVRTTTCGIVVAMPL